jgi:hypothetical protein
MTKKIDTIKSLDELSEGDVVDFIQMNPKGIQPNCIVARIGEVPGHEREVILHPLYSPDSPEDPRYLRIKISEQQVIGAEVFIEKNIREDYKGWKYVGINTVN